MSTLAYHKHLASSLTKFFDMVGETYLPDTQVLVAEELNIQVDVYEWTMDHIMHLQRVASKHAADKAAKAAK